jgi:arylsulfatase A-like enzyme
MQETELKPNILFIMTDQLSALALQLYGGAGVPTPHLDALAKRGVTFDNMISTCPVCTPFRSMWLTGRHPQTTGHVVNGIRTRRDEIGWGHVFENAGYDTGYVGKWHLNHERDVQVPKSSNRLGFRWWRGYNLHADFHDGSYDLGDTGRTVHWKGYETDALTHLAFEFIDSGRDRNKPFCLMVNPHQPHIGGSRNPDRMAPDEYYDALPEQLPFPPCLSDQDREVFQNDYRHYFALILAVDDMVGGVVRGLDERGLLNSTILVVSSDHGTQLGTHPVENTHPFWTKKRPWETNIHTPLIVHWPGTFSDGRRCDTLTAPVDLLPTFCGLCNIPIPSTVEGIDLSRAWLGEANAPQQDEVYMMNFTYRFVDCEDGWEWRGIRTQTHTYARFLSGETILFDNRKDPWQQNNLIDSNDHDTLATEYEERLQELMAKRKDALNPGSFYRNWLDDERRVVRNANGYLGNPECKPDFSLL